MMSIRALLAFDSCLDGFASAKVEVVVLSSISLFQFELKWPKATNSSLLV
jgi:hypothetical protein